MTTDKKFKQETEKKFNEISQYVQATNSILMNLGQQIKDLSDRVGEVNASLDTNKIITSSIINYLQKNNQINIQELDVIYTSLRAEHWENISKADNDNLGLIPAEEVKSEEDYIIITTDCKDNKAASIFRSKMQIKNINSEIFQEFRKTLINKKVGDVLDLQIEGNMHNIKILSILTKKEEK